MTPDAVLHRYVELVFGQRIDIDALYRLVSLDADLLSRWIHSLGCKADPDDIRGALAKLDTADLTGIARAHVWSVAPLGAAARLGLDQWRAVLRAACVAECLGNRIAVAAPEGARLRTLLAISGINLPQDPLMTEVVEFRGTPIEQLVDAHPLLRMFAVVEALEHQSATAAAEAARRLFDMTAADFDQVLGDAEQAADRLVEDTAITDGPAETWRDRLWMHAQVMAFSNVIARQTDLTEIYSLAKFVTRGLFNQVPRCFLFDAASGALGPINGGDDLAALRLPLDSSPSVVARALRERTLIEIEDGPELPVADRQIMRRLGAERVCAVPMLSEDGPVGALVFRLTDDDRGDIGDMMQLYAEDLCHWLSARQREAAFHDSAFLSYQQEHEKRLREIVHEANNPLSIIHNYLHILELRLQDQTGVQEQLRLIGDEIRRAADIIKRAGVVSRGLGTERVARAPVAEVFDLNDLVRDVMELMLGQAEAQGVEMHETLLATGVRVHSDRDRVKQIMTNLVRNAVEAMRDGGNLVVETNGGVYRAGRAGVELVIRDDGPGLPADVLQRLWEPKRSGKGGEHAGLGLHITARLVEELEGAIDVRTLPDRGTSFSVFVPELA